MAPREYIGIRLDPELLKALRAVQERDGVPVSEQIRRAIRAWLVERGELPKPRPSKPPS